MKDQLKNFLRKDRLIWLIEAVILMSSLFLMFFSMKNIYNAELYIEIARNAVIIVACWFLIHYFRD